MFDSRVRFACSIRVFDSRVRFACSIRVFDSTLRPVRTEHSIPALQTGSNQRCHQKQGTRKMTVACSISPFQLIWG